MSQQVTAAPPAPMRIERAEHGPSPWASLVSVTGRLLVWGLLVALVVAIVYPLLWMVLSGFKSNQEVFGSPWGLPGALRWEYYAHA